jgi:uncharacterized protein (DUF4415 family)
MTKSKNAGAAPWADPDDAPELDEAYFARADVYEGETLIRPARKPGQRGPQKAPTKEMVTLRLDRDVVAAYRATGPGWQARMNDALKAAMRQKSAKAAGSQPVRAAGKKATP